MSNLYVNGCSYTYGHPVEPIEENARDIKLQRPNWTWAEHLSDHYSNYVNQAWLGGSNHRIFRRTLEFFEGVDAADWTAVIQWTNPDRFEYYDAEHDTYVGVLVNDVVLDDRSWNKFIDNSILLQNFNLSVAYHTFMRNSQSRLEEYWMMSTVLAQYFRKRDIKFLFTTMSANGHPRYTDPGVYRYTVDASDYTADAISRILGNSLRQNPPGDTHPNKAGHFEIYKYIQHELSQRHGVYT